MSLLDNLYYKMPKWLQDLSLTLYGAHQANKRFRGAFNNALNEIKRTQLLNEIEIAELQNRKLQALVAYGYQHVPYYTDTLDKCNAKPQDVNLSTFKEVFPILEKAQIAQNPNYYISQDQKITRGTLFTSGTTGTPLTISYDDTARQINYAFYCWLLSLFDASYSSPSVTFAGRKLFSGEAQQFWRKDYWNRTLYCSSYYLSEDTLPAYIKAMEEWNPTFIDAYPSAIYLVADFIQRSGLRHRIQPRLIFTSSETLLDYQYETIRQVFNCPIIDQYGCTEMAVMAYRINDSAYQIHPLYSLVELFDRDEETNSSELVCTGLFNFSMPLIRYRMGDRVSGFAHKPGFEFQSQFSTITGRLDDFIKTPEGKMIGRLDPAFKGITGIKEAQIIQEKIDQLVIRLSTTTDCSRSALETRLATNLQDRTSKQMKIAFDYDTPIERTKSGKFKSVICRV
jgi:phenylacetate-CoA ligase